MSAQLGIPPGAVQLERLPGGKPVVANAPDLHVNLAHSDTLAVVAVSTLSPVGVDVERLRPVGEALIATACTPGESDRLRGRAPAEREREFLQLWTAKEAFLKACGRGLSVEPAMVDALAVLDVGRAELDGYTVSACSVASDHVGAFAYVDAA